MKSKRLLVITVMVSIALNLLLVGVMFGRIAGPGPELHRVDPVMGMRRLLSDLPDERATALAPYYREYFSAVRPRFREIRGAQNDLRQAMLTDPLDQEAVKTALSAFRQHLFNSQGSAHDAFTTLAAELTLTEREQLVAFMSERPSRDGRPSLDGRPPRPFSKNPQGRPPGAPAPPQ